MSAPQCSVCGLEGVRLYRPVAGHGVPAEEYRQFLRCNAHVPASCARVFWVPFVQESLKERLACALAVEREFADWLRLQDAAFAPLWMGGLGWIDIENAPVAT